MTEPPGKKARTDEGPEAAKEPEAGKEPEAAKEPEPPQETEEDEAADRLPRIAATVAFHTEETTMNCLVSSFGSMLMPLTDGGLQYLLAGARANVGLKSGRYLFEVKVIECQHPTEDLAARTKVSLVRNQLRVGVSTARSPLFLGETEESICFCLDGALMHNKTKEMLPVKFVTGDVMAVLLNLNTKSPNANTISVFKNGERMCQPHALPESLRGKPLFPSVTLKNVIAHYNFGPVPLIRLPFAARMVAEAREKDSVVTSPSKKGPQDKQQVLFPVGLPDEGTFDWLDMFMAEHDGFTELSDRAVLHWAEKSGLSKPKGSISQAATELVGQRNSNDKPEMGFGITTFDDGSVRRVLHSVAPMQTRDYIVMEVKSNLLRDERKEMLAKWAGSVFKRTAIVAVGEPPLRFKKKSQEWALRDKQHALNEQFKAKKAEEKRKKFLAKKQRKLERERKKAEKAAKEKQEALTKKLEEERRRKERAAQGEPPEEKEDTTKEASEAKPDEEEEEEEEAEEEEKDEEPPKAELTTEEKKQWFRKTATPDLSTYALNTAFMKFSLPDNDEGFDNIKYEWYKEEACKKYLKDWVRDRKATTRVEDLQPSEWFTTRWKEWQRTLQTWHAKQNQHKAALAKKVVTAAATTKKKEAAKEEKEKENGSDANKAAGGEEQEKPKEAQAEAAGEEPQKPEAPAVDFEHLDVFGVEDVLDLGGGQPLFSAFNLEDWTMLSLRFELYLLIHAFRRDVNDPDRLGIYLEHLPFYYNKYFKKSLNIKFYGVESLKELMTLIRDTVVVRGKSDVIETQLPEEMESFGVFAMLTEESRRDRMRRVDLGDESAKLKLATPPSSGAMVRPPQQQQQQQQTQLQQQQQLQQHLQQQQQQLQQQLQQANAMKAGSSGATAWPPGGWKGQQMAPATFRPWGPTNQAYRW